MAGDFLVPLLRTQAGAPDPVAIETWHLALASTVAVEIPHDLFALWLFPRGGGTVLLGPAALAEDHIEVPAPSPRLEQDQLFALEETLRRARYPSAIAIPIREPEGDRDAGAMLLGSFSRGAFGPPEAAALWGLAGQLSPALGDLAERVSSAPPALLERSITRDTLPEHLARAASEAAGGADLVRRASGALHPVLPHDWLEILAAGTLPGTLLPLGSESRKRWSAEGDPDPLLALLSRTGAAGTLMVPDLEAIEGGAVRLDLAPGPVRSLVGVRLAVAGELTGYLLIGSASREAFRPDDQEILVLAGLILSPRVQAERAGVSGGGGTESGAVASPPIPAPEEPPLPRAAAALAGTAELAEGWRRFGEELGRVLPHAGLSVHLRRGEWEVISLDPAAPRPVTRVPALALEDFPGSAVIRETREWTVRSRDGNPEVFVPLRVAARVIGALGIRVSGTVADRAAAALARPFADLAAPHLEILRRAVVQESREGPLTAAAGWDRPEEG